MHPAGCHLIVTLGIILACAPAASAGTVVYVDQHAAGPAHDGETWCTAFLELQDALATADATGGAEIRIADGVYRPAAPGGDRHATFALSGNIRILGGFAGCGAADPDQRDPLQHQTVLSGDLNANDRPDFVGYDENVFHVVTISDLANSAAMNATGGTPVPLCDGVTITGGQADGPPPHDRGAGVYCDATAPALTNCRIAANAALRRGGGMYNVRGTPTITDCTLAANRAVHLSGVSGGGGLYNDTGHPVLTRCTFESNTSPSAGGALHLGSADATLNGCVFRANAGGFGGAVFSVADSTLTDCSFISNSGTLGGGMAALAGAPVLTRCDFFDNSAADLGGAFGTDNDASPRFQDCTFIGNTSGKDAGAVHLLAAGTARLTNCAFFGNSTGRFGGAIQITVNDIEMSNCLFSGNFAFSGGAIMTFAGGRQRFSNCTIVQNIAADFAGGVFIVGGSGEMEFTSSILWNNVHPGAGGEAAQIGLKGTTSLDVSYSLIEGLNTIAGKGNIDDDPLFVDADGADDLPGTADDDVRLAADSPCIEAGDPNFVAPLGTVDLDGHARVLCTRVDMGAFEFGIGDVDCDRDVDLVDFAQRARCVTGPRRPLAGARCAPFDFDGDLDVDHADFAGFQVAFNARRSIP